MRNKIVIIIFAIMFLILGISSMLKKSPTADEIAHHIPVGYILLQKGDFKFDTSQPPLARMIEAYPLLFMDIKLADEPGFWRREDRAEFGKEFFYMQKSPEKILFLSRLMILILSCLGGLILYLWVRRLYAEDVAVLSAILYYLSPNIIAHGRLATIDMTFTVFVILSVFLFWEFIRKKTVLSSVFAGFFLGLALLSKHSGVVLILIYLIFLAVEFIKIKGRKPFFAMVVLLFIISFLTLWAGYGFETKPLLADVMRPQEKIDMVANFPVLQYTIKNVPIPAGSYLIGLLGVLKHGIEGHRSFLLGRWYTHGNRLFFIVAFLIKTPIPTIILFIWGLVISIRRRLQAKERFILSIIVVYFIIASMSKLQLGLRYILQIYPFIFIFAALALQDLFKKKFILKALASCLLLWLLIANIYIWPDYLAYFNESIGGPSNGYKYLRDSNIDWGQDLPGLKEDMQDENISKIKLHYFGSAEPEHHGIEYEKLSKEFTKPKKDIYAISVMSMDSVAWTGDYEPDRSIGYSILIYDFRDKEKAQ